MKIRTGFVANSSSSSFIIAYKNIPEIVLPDSVPKWVVVLVKKAMGDILESSESRYSEDNSTVITNIQELQEYYLGNYCYPSKGFDKWKESEDYKKYYKEDYEKHDKLINNGYNILFREVDNCNMWLQELLKSLPEKEEGNGMFLIGGGR